MQAVVVRTGVTPLKGARHPALDGIELTPDGVHGDRLWCLVDAEQRRVARTADVGALVTVRARLAGDRLVLELPDGTSVDDAPEVWDKVESFDYFGKVARLRLAEGPHAEALSDIVGGPFLLASATGPGEIVWGGGVSLVTTTEIAELADRIGLPAKDLDPARFRLSLVIDDSAAPLRPASGVTIAVGDATIRLRGGIPRCVVVDRDPKTGGKDHPVLATLAQYRKDGQDLLFGWDADVLLPGTVRPGDLCHPL